jgi:hypothetical protein
MHRAWLARQRLDDPLAQEVLERLLIRLDRIERQLATLDAPWGEIAGSERWAGQVQILTQFRGVSTLDRARADRRDWRLRAVLASARARFLVGDHGASISLRANTAWIWLRTRVR